MKTSLRGYTIFEVMIVLAVTSVLFISAVAVFSGRRQKTEFAQFMYDLQSKVQHYANEVSTGSFPATSGLGCQKTSTASGPRPQLIASTQGQSTSQDCLYIGRAIQAVPGSDTLYIYSVLGLRDKYDSSGNDTGEAVTSLADAQPDVAYQGSNYKLMDTYSLLNGVTVQSSKYYTTSVTSQSAELLQLYTTFQRTSANSQAMTAYTIPGLSTIPNPTGTTVDVNMKKCLELQSPCDSPTRVGDLGWKLCVKDSGPGGQQGELTVLSTTTGITTKLTIGACTP